MAIRIKFDDSYNVETPALLLAKKSGEIIGKLDAFHIAMQGNLSYPEFSCTVYKTNNGIVCPYWNEIKDFRLVWCMDWNLWFEISVETDESDETIKHIEAKSLGAAELSQIKLYNIEINTENDIKRDDYKTTVLFASDATKNDSLLSRIMEKAPHYKIAHVDDTIKNIQRTFTFDDVSIYDAFNGIAEEINCIFEINVKSDENRKIQRTISVYDLESNCRDCGYRGEFTGKCPKCGSTDITEGYGNDTTIFISSQNLADSITFTTDVDSVKNCFKLKAGDDTMTAAIRNCNPNGSDYIWHISDEQKNDMSKELSDKFDTYHTKYKAYETETVIPIDNGVLNKYTGIANKYAKEDKNFKIQLPIKGYSNLMNAYYNAIDFEYYLNNEMMPPVSLPDAEKITAESEGKKIEGIKGLDGTTISVVDLTSCSKSTADSIALSYVKIYINSQYQVKVVDSNLTKETGSAFKWGTWSGKFKLTNYADEDDTYTTQTIELLIDENLQAFCQQRIDAVLKKETESFDIAALFKKDNSNYNTADTDFKNALKLYSLVSLNTFLETCQSCIDILIEQGISDKDSWSTENDKENIYNNLYLDYYGKLVCIQSEISIKDNELNIIRGLKSEIESKRNHIQDELNLEKYLGAELWNELSSHRREDTFSNENYISDGLNNAEIFDNARKFIEVAQNELLKSATLQHSITSKLRNLLVMKEFAPIADKFEIGNWLRICVDDRIYKLRLVGYEIDFDNPDDINVEFSDVTYIPSGYSDIQSLLGKMSSISTSYDYVARQAEKGSEGRKYVENWMENGFKVTATKIVNADNQNITWDSHGILLREQLPYLDEYSPNQTKIINKGLFITNDNWQTAKAGIGKFTYYDPEENIYKDGYGVIADTICSNLILSKAVGIYNETGSIKINKDGITINTTGTDSDANTKLFTIQKSIAGSSTPEKLLYVDGYGNLNLKGNITANSLTLGSGVAIEQSKISGLPNKLTSIENKQADLTKKQTELRSTVEGYQTQIDGKIETYYQSNTPTLEDGNDKHIGDLWYNPDTGLIKRWDGTKWENVTKNFSSDIVDAVKNKITIFTTDTIPAGYKVGDKWVNNEFEYECISTSNNNILDWVLTSPVRENLLIATSKPDSDNNFKNYLVNNGGNVEYRTSASMGSSFLIKATNGEKYMYTSRADVQAGKTYTLSFLAATTGGTGTQSLLDVYCGYSTKKTSELSYTSADGVVDTSGLRLNVLVSNTYKLVAISFTVPVNMQSVYFRIDNNNFNNLNEYQLTITNLKLEYGNCASSYTVNSSDPAYAYESLKQGNVLMVDGSGKLRGNFAPKVNVTEGSDNTVNVTFTDGSYGGNTFVVPKTGLIIADNIVTRGTVIASNGIIAGYTISGQYLQSSDQKVGMGTTAEWAFWAGYENGEATFQVKQNGEIIAKAGNIAGFNISRIGSTRRFALLYGEVGKSQSIFLSPQGLDYPNIYIGSDATVDACVGISDSFCVTESGRLICDGASIVGIESKYHTIENHLQINGYMNVDDIRAANVATDNKNYIQVKNKLMSNGSDLTNATGYVITMGADNNGDCGNIYFGQGTPSTHVHQAAINVNSSGTGKLSIRNKGIIQLHADYVNTGITARGTLHLTQSICSISVGGSDTSKHTIAYNGNTSGWSVDSDIRLKENIKSFSDIDEAFFDALEPRKYNYKNNKEIVNFGFIANKISDFCKENDYQKLSFLVEPDENNEYYSLCYNDFIALNTHEIQKLKKRVAELEKLLLTKN